MSISSWGHSAFTHKGITHETYRKGVGPAVVVVHEIPGITPKVLEFAERVVAQGFTVVMPLLVGEEGREPSGGYIASSMSKICISREFTTMAMRKTSPIISWLRALAKQIHREVGGVGVGAVGMCFSGGFALGMMVDDIMVAPVLSQPSMPFAIGAHRSADLNLSPNDEARIVERAQAGCQVMGLRFTGDKLVGTRFDSLHKLLGDAFIAVEFESSTKQDHSVLTEQIQEEGVARVLEFLKLKLLK
jgi:dienelactone hydrolase